MWHFPDWRCRRQIQFPRQDLPLWSQRIRWEWIIDGHFKLQRLRSADFRSVGVEAKHKPSAFSNWFENPNVSH